MLKVISPVDGKVYVTRPFSEYKEIDKKLENAVAAQQEWKLIPVNKRANIISQFVDEFVADAEAVSKELSWQMGRPIRYSQGEVKGTEERARYMIQIAEDSLKDINVGKKEGFHRYIHREPLGVVFVIPAWNYPYLIAVNSIVSALIAGNAVVLKHSAQTPLCAERFAKAFEKAGLPDELFSYLHLTHKDTADVIRDDRIDYVAFTGSVSGGHSIQKVASERFIGVGLELGGKDPAYVRHDANLENAIENLVDGAFFNSGQSCCGIERIYVHENVYDTFVEGFVDLTNQYKLGNPLNPDTTIGPVAKKSGAELVRAHISDALNKGAKALIESNLFPKAKENSNYLAPQVLVDVDHTMDVMTEETFGPVVGIMIVSSDEEAVKLMNDSPYGLTASVWTEDEGKAVGIGNKVNTGTWFMNRCDYLDPALAWVGVKDSGRGCTLSSVGYEHLTRPKSYHLKIKT